ncbi:MAG: ABC transporter substrate-binding protein [Arenicella sp.]
MKILKPISKSLNALLICSGVLTSTSTIANEGVLKVAVSSEPTSLDPHYHNLTTNNQIIANLFEGLTKHDPKFNVVPSLATSWNTIDETTWRFDLRKGVNFHDGSEFDASDVIYSLCRVSQIDDSPAPFTSFTKAIVSIETKNDHTLLIKTAKPSPLLPKDLSAVGIISSNGENIVFNKDGCTSKSDWPSTKSFNLGEGKQAVGTGSYKFENFTKGDKITFARFDEYWGGQKPWNQIVIKAISSGGPRVAALLSGDVDMVENPPVQDIPRIKKEGQFDVSETVTSRVIYLMFNHKQDGPPPTIKGTDGKNPFLDPRVREAISVAINREAISDRIMGGLSVPANQYLHTSMFGTDKKRPPIKYDINTARSLLAQAGYPDGFELTLFATNDRYINDEKIVQAIAQMLTKVGIKTKVETMTKSIFFKRRNKGEYGIWMAGWGAATGEMSNPLRGLVATRIKEKGYGIVNRGGYSNPSLDSLLDQAMAEVDDEKRASLLIDAQAKALDETAVVPVHFEMKTWALKKGLSYEGRSDEWTLISDVKKSK